MRQFEKKVVKAIFEAKEELRPFLKSLNFAKISKHNHGYLRYARDPVKFFIDVEVIRYLHTVNFIYLSYPKSTWILDIGFFIPVVPLGLSKLGFRVSSVEKLSYYNGALDEIISFIAEKYGVRILDFDPLVDNIADLKHQFDVVLLLAILEHLNGSPNYLLEKTKSIVKPNGCIIVEVPNIASLIKRLALLLKGESPCPRFEDYYHSEYPFTGHNREYTINELKYTLDQAGFDVIKLKVFHHSAILPQGLKGKILHTLELIGPQSWKPNIWAVAKPRENYFNPKT